MIALIAGQGALPQVVAQALTGQDWQLCALEGYAPSVPGPVKTFRIETLGSFIAGLKRDGVTRVCFAGAIARPPIDATQIDAETLPLVPRMLQALQAGDDGALRTVISFFEEAGIVVVGAQEIVPELLPPEGVLVGGVLKEGKLLRPTGKLRVEEGDVIALFTMSADVPEVERLLQVSIDFF